VTVDRHAELRDAKGLMTDRNFEGEFTTLLNLAEDLARRNEVALPREDIRHALRELLIAFPVYRTWHRERVNPAGRGAAQPRGRQRGDV
jgi:(1->4)-alpha-D-glucan 1-alpha-D-glucosylmutase